MRRSWKQRSAGVSEQRWIGVRSESGLVFHAVWVTYSREIPELQKEHDHSQCKENYHPWPTEPAQAMCGVKVKIRWEAGPNHGGDWDRIVDRDRCQNCLRSME